ncbi:MAG: hypothetical protein EOP88_28295, partial [Verrucomicrobiaceae bacterium]
MNSSPSHNIDTAWFRASETTGDYMGIRYGRLVDGMGEPEWYYVSHCDCDGIGGFARLLREYGEGTPPLPQTTSPCRGTIGPLWRLIFGGAVVKGPSARRADWAPPATSARSGPSAAVAWHAFTVEETAALRAEVQNSHLRVPWMVPVNLRGDIRHRDETENHVSCVEVHIA